MQQILIDNQRGPLPITIEFQNPGDIPIGIQFSGSGTTSNTDTLIGIELSIDDVALGQSIIWSNGSSIHRTTIPKTIIKNLDLEDKVPVKHKLTLSSIPGTTTDYNDYFSVILAY